MALNWTRLQTIFRKPNRRYPSIPTITDEKLSHTAALKQMKEASEIHERRAGDIRDSFVRVGELEDLLDDLFADSGWPGFATPKQTEQGKLGQNLKTAKAIHPWGGAYAYDRLWHPNLHKAGKSTEVVTLVADTYLSVDYVTIDCSLSNVFEYTMTGTTHFNAPINTAETPPLGSPVTAPFSGQTINIFIRQDSTGSRALTFDTAFTFVGGTQDTTATANAVDMVSMCYDSTAGKWRCSYLADFQ